MVIQRMNNVLVKHSKVLFGIFTAVIIVSFVWFFTPGIDGSLLFGGGYSEKSTYGTFQDEKITFGDIRKAMRQISIVYSGAEVPEEAAFFFAAQMRAAEKLGITVSDEELAEDIASMPQFQKDGVFSQDLYREFEKKRLTPFGYAAVDFENARRAMLQVDKISSLVTGAVTLSDSEYRNLLKQKMEKFSFRIVQFIPETLTGEVKVNDADLEAFFNSKPDDFLPPPRCSGLVAYVLNADHKTPVNAEAVKAYYEKNKDQYKDKDGKVKPFEAAAKDIEAELSAFDTAGAEKIVNAFYQKVRELARSEEYKTDYIALFTAAAREAGMKLAELKDITEADTVGAPAKLGPVAPAAARALAALKRVGSITNKTRGADGFYVGLLTGRIVQEKTTFAEARDRVESAYRMTKAADLVPVQAEKFRAALKKSKNPAADLEKLGKEYMANVFKFPAALPRMLLEQNPNTAMWQGILFETPAGQLSLPLRQGGLEEMIFMDSREQASADELKELASNEAVRMTLLDEKKRSAAMEYAAWLQGNCRLVATRKREGQQNE